MFIDRAHDIDVADPTYFTKYARYLNQEAFYAEQNATIPDYDVMPQRVAVRPEYDDVFEDSNWWVFLALDLLRRAGECCSRPFFRNKGTHKLTGESLRQRVPYTITFRMSRSFAAVLISR